MKIRNNTISKKGNSLNSTVEVSLTNNQRILPQNEFYGTISQAEQYNNERENCNKIRLVVTINPICTNVLFNRITEVVLDEGTDNCKCLNYEKNLTGDFVSLMDERGWNGKSVTFFGSNYGTLEYTRDTQLTANGLGIDYKPGLDIFNNHLLRSTTFKTVCDATAKKREFNTILDYMREWNGTQVKTYNYDNSKSDIHLYLKEEIMDYDTSVDTNLDEDGGWLGFTNKGKIVTYTADGSEILPINKVINNQPACAFIDMCPDRTLWFFTPKYNKPRNRFEKNWNYCLTYPYSSTTKGISFIRENSNSLKIYYFDDTVTLGGVSACKIATFSKHGLQSKDTINLYVNGSERNENGDTIIKNITVLKVIDDYTFYVKYSDSNWFYNSRFISWENSVGFVNCFKGSEDAGKYIWDVQNRNTITYTDNEGNTHIFTVFVDDNGYYRANIDPTSNDVSFKQVYNGEEVKYYVRLFRKLPNWKFAETIPNEYTDDNELEELIKRYSTKEYEIDNNLSNLSFAKNAYGDDISQIVFTDDIDINLLKDNLGRPLTDIFLTVIKNNAGYREWYGKNGKNIDVTGSTIEFSHVFGKVSCAFELSPATVLNPNHKNIIQTNNTGNMECFTGLDISEIIDEDRPEIIENDEIEFNSIGKKDTDDYYDGDNVFYGDLCLYSPATIAETVIDDIWFRFNTAQRELTFNDKANEYLNTLFYDHILTDDYDPGGFNATVEKITNACASAEGYKYHPHYRIPIKSISRELYTASPRIVNAIEITYDNNNKIYTILTNDESYVELKDKFIIYNPYRNEYYHGQITDVISPKMFRCTLSSEIEDKEVYLFDNTTYRVIKKQETIPEDATLLKDGSLLYAWREIKQNGFDSYSTNEVYPFTNGALYIEKNIRFFVKRQDPNSLLSGVFMSEINDVQPEHKSILNEDQYYNNISCFTEDFTTGMQNNVRNNANQVANAVKNMF